jgi:cellulose synthase operon protein YhjQ
LHDNVCNYLMIELAANRRSSNKNNAASLETGNTKMDSRNTDKADDAVIETPEDVAVLYSWANLHGAKYRDFSASRREYRAQLRHRAAEQVREQALLAQADAETAAAAAESAARHAAEAARSHKADDADSAMRRALREAESAARTAAAERLEAARRAEAAAVAEAAARREEREIAEAHASAQRQAARFAESEMCRKALALETSNLEMSNLDAAIPVSAPISFQPELESAAANQEAPSANEIRTDEKLPNENRRYTDRPRQEDSVIVAAQPERRASAGHSSPRRPQGYHPDDASGVRQIYRGPDSSVSYTSGTSSRRALPLERRAVASASPYESKPAAQYPIPTPRPLPNANESQAPSMGQRSSDPQVQAPQAPRPPQADSPTPSVPVNAGQWPPFSTDPAPIIRESNPSPARPTTPRSPVSSRIIPASPSPRPVSPFSQALVPSDSTRGRRAQDDFDYQHSQGFPDRRSTPESLSDPATLSSQRSANQADPTGPAWLYAPPAPQITPRPLASPVQSSVADTLQHSRERVAARWYALKGVFEQPGPDGLEQPEVAPVRQKETRTPVLAVFSLAGGVGKTSLVATVGRALSSMGEKVLLTDTTSHGLLPFYFGASELRHGTVRTFSPPSGSTDAPIYLVSHEIDYKGCDAAAQEKLAEEIIDNSRGTHRILLDLNVSSSWIVSRLSRMNPTILVPVAPDMNSVISLQALEKFFSGIVDGDGRPLQPYYILNQFDTSLPLHLDVREVMRRQLGDRLLPFVIRRAPAVSEALAEGMTVVDYAPDAPVSEDYINLATWLRTVAAPATAGFRNVRWSER